MTTKTLSIILLTLLLIFLVFRICGFIEELVQWNNGVCKKTGSKWVYNYSDPYAESTDYTDGEDGENHIEICSIFINCCLYPRKKEH